MYCRHCGNKLDEGSKFCSVCGAPVEVQRSDSSAGQKQGGASDNPFAENFSADAPGRQYTPPPQQNYPPPYPPPQEPRTNPDDRSSFGWGLLGFFIPLAGLILYLVWRTEYPLRAKSVGKGALVSVILYAVLVVLYIILGIALVSVNA